MKRITFFCIAVLVMTACNRKHTSDWQLTSDDRQPANCLPLPPERSCAEKMGLQGKVKTVTISKNEIIHPENYYSDYSSLIAFSYHLKRLGSDSVPADELSFDPMEQFYEGNDNNRPIVQYLFDRKGDLNEKRYFYNLNEPHLGYTAYHYDDNHRLVGETAYTEADYMYYFRYNQYDSLGRRTYCKEGEYTDDFTITTYEYDNLGNCVKEVYLDASDSVTGYCLRTFNDNGDLLQQQYVRYGLTSCSEHKYDDKGYLTELIIYKQQSSMPDYRELYVNDKRGHRISDTHISYADNPDGDTVSVFTYDVDRYGNRLKERKIYADGTHDEFTRTFDAHDNLRTRVYKSFDPSDNQTAYSDCKYQYKRFNGIDYLTEETVISSMNNYVRDHTVTRYHSNGQQYTRYFYSAWLPEADHESPVADEEVGYTCYNLDWQHLNWTFLHFTFADTLGHNHLVGDWTQQIEYYDE